MKILLCLFCFVTLCFGLLNHLGLKTINKSCGTCGDVYLTVTAKDKFFVANWRFECKRRPDQVKVYKKISEIEKTFELLYTVDVKQNQKTGHVKTNVSFVFKFYPGNWDLHLQEPTTSIRCFPYYITAFKMDKIMCWSCFDIHPMWMSRFPDLRLGEMMIPGTFKSGAIERLSASKSVYQRFDLWGQLVLGIRYIDLLVGEKKSNNSYHDNINRLYSQLSSIVQFMEISKKEVIILDIQGVVESNQEFHNKLLNILKKYFNNLIIPRDFPSNGLGPKLSQLWAVNKRILINYRHKQIALQHKWLWYEIFLKNGKARSREEIKEYMFKVIRNHRHDELFCNFIAGIDGHSIYNGTYNDKDTVFHRDADIVNPYLHDWITQGEILDDINIVSVPFFEGTRIIDDAIEVNKRKKPSDDPFCECE